MAKRQKTTRFSIKDFDMAHYRATEQYANAVDKLFAVATEEIARAASKADFNPDKPFTFDDYPKVKAATQTIVAGLTKKVQTVVETGSRKQWLFSCKKNDAFIKSVFDTTKLKKSELKQMMDKRLDALATFQGRKVAGMNLSQRVWKYTTQFREQIEHALDVGLGEGRSAQELSRDVRQNLKDPNRLFRRVRDKRGNLVLSKAAQAFHPGQGVYRSSYKNAMRLTRSEINMAYRESDYQRWQALDFVVGFEIMRSNHEPLCKCSTCEKLVGRYPKTFKFVGWHPQCMCFAIPIMEDFYSEGRRNDRVNRLKAALNGTTAKKYISPETIDKMPDGFNEWVDAHKDIQKNWSSTPYFIRDNFKNGNLADGLKISIPVVPAVKLIVTTPQSTTQPETTTEQVQQPTQFEAKIGVNPIAEMEGVHVLSETKLEAAINKTRKMLIRQDKEKMVVLNSKGVAIIETKGTSSNVCFDEETAKKVANATITHNHPSGKNTTGVLRFGYSLSSDDVYEAIRCDTRGIVAEAPYYRYSIERPNSGWRVDAHVVRKRYDEIFREIKKKYGASLSKHHAENIIQHLTMKQLAKEFGFTYKHEKKG